MNYETLHLVQGTEAWHHHRNHSDNASDLAGVLGLTKKKTRDEVIKEYATGLSKEFSSYVEDRILPEGHRAETLARPLAEKIVGAELLPATVATTVDGLQRKLSASLDGNALLDVDGELIEVNWEHKSLNQDLAESLDQGIIPDEYHPQMEQGMLINGATRCLFSASKWDDKNELIDSKHVWYESNPELRARIIPAWKLLEDDVANYRHVEVIEPVKAAPVRELPALFVQAKGEVTNSNMPAFKVAVTDFLAELNLKPETDQQFADAKAIAAKLREGAKAIKGEGKKMLEQTADIGAIARDIEILAEQMNDAALTLEKAVEREEKARKERMIQEAQNELREHIQAINDRLGLAYMPAISGAFAEAIKGKRNVESMQAAVNTELANKKLSADSIGALIDENLKTMATLAADLHSLFPDLKTIVTKAADDFTALVKMRVQEHRDAVAKREAQDKADLEAKQSAAPTVEEVAKTLIPQPVAIATRPTRAIAPAATLMPPQTHDRATAIIGLIATMDDSELELVEHYAERILAQRKQVAA